METTDTAVTMTRTDADAVAVYLQGCGMDDVIASSTGHGPAWHGTGITGTIIMAAIFRLAVVGGVDPQLVTKDWPMVAFEEVLLPAGSKGTWYSIELEWAD